MVEYQRFDWKEYVPLKKYFKLESRCQELEKENKRLEEENLLQLAEIRRLRERLGDYKKLKIENRRMKEELSIYDREYFDENKKYKNILMEEDTLQELIDLGEI